MATKVTPIKGYKKATFTKGVGPQEVKTDLYNQQQQAQQNQAGQLAQEHLGGLALPGQGLQGDKQQYNFQHIADNSINRFNRETIPGLAARFAGLGSGAAGSSPLLQHQLGGAAADLQAQLGELGANYGQRQQQLNLSEMDQQANNLRGLQGFGNTQQQASTIIPGQQSGLQGLTQAVGGVIPQVAAAYLASMGVPPAAAPGAATSAAASNTPINPADWRVNGQMPSTSQIINGLTPR